MVAASIGVALNTILAFVFRIHDGKRTDRNDVSHDTVMNIN